MNTCRKFHQITQVFIQGVFSFRAADTTHTDSPICIVFFIRIANSKELWLWLENFHFNFYIQLYIHQPSQQQKTALLKALCWQSKQVKCRKSVMDCIRNRTAFEESAAWMDPREDICWDCLQIQKCEGSGWSLLESGGILQGLQLSCGWCPSLHHWEKWKATRNMKVSLKTGNILPAFIPSLCFPVSTELHCWSWRRTEAATLLCWDAGPLLVLGWFLNLSQNPSSATAAAPLHFLKNTESP